MKFFKIKVIWYSETDGKMITDIMLLCAVSFNDAMEKISDYYGEEEIEEIYINLISNEHILPIDSKIEQALKEIDSF